jgi:hypothetical protein
MQRLRADANGSCSLCSNMFMPEAIFVMHSTPERLHCGATSTARRYAMSVLLETSVGDIVIDLLTDYAPKCCEKYVGPHVSLCPRAEHRNQRPDTSV